MAARTLTTMTTNVRTFIQDTSSTAQAFTDAQLMKWINTGLLWMYEGSEKRVKTATLVASWGANTFEVTGDATCLYPEILEASLNAGAGAGQLPLRRMGWSELRYRQQVVTAAATPTHWAGLKKGGAALSASAQNKWLFALLPVPTGTVVLEGIVRDYPTLLTTGADLIDLGEYEAECAEIIAAIIAAPRMGRPDLAADLMGLLPKLIQDKLTTHATRDEVNA